MSESYTERGSPLKNKPYDLEIDGETVWFMDDEHGNPVMLDSEPGVSSLDEKLEPQVELSSAHKEQEEVYTITGESATPPPQPRAENVPYTDETIYDARDAGHEASTRKHTLRKCLAGFALGATASLALAPYAVNASATKIMTEGGVAVSYGEHFTSMLERYVNKGNEE